MLRTKLVSLLLSWTLLWTSAVWATSTQYNLPGTPLLFADAAQTPAAAWTLSNRTSGTGRVSARYDKGPGAQPAWYEVRCWISLSGTPNVVGSTIEYYLSTSDGTHSDGEIGTADAALASDTRRALTPVGVLTIYQTTTNTTMTASFRNIYIPSRYFSLAMWNATGLPTETNTNKHGCTATPTSPQMQNS
jgi:hypothetical protein